MWIWPTDDAAAWGEIDPEAVIIADTLDAASFIPAELARLGALGPALEQVLVLGNFGMETGLDAWNVAWFAGATALAVRVRTLKQAMTICTPAPGQYAALAALEGATA